MLWLTLDLPALRQALFKSQSPSEASALTQLACWGGRFTPHVSIGRDSVSFEIAGSLRLFGGLPRLLEEMRADLVMLDTVAPSMAVAPTALAARWLARAGGNAAYTELTAMRKAMEPLSLRVIDVSPPVAQRLESLGLRCIGQLLALPRSAIGQRLGQPLLLDLARALGELPDPQHWFEFPEQFEQALELPAPVEAAPALLFAARRLVAALCGWLEVRQASVRQLRLDIGHEQREPDILLLAFSTPVHSTARIERVLKERLSSFRLSAAAVSLRLCAEHYERRVGSSATLFDGSGLGDDELGDLLDRLVARLGAGAVQAVSCHADHRPEAASRLHDSAQAVPVSGQAINASSRPLWLIEPPERLPEVRGRPVYQGRLQWLGNPERIESGWWDGADIKRDYFIAVDQKDRWLWIFRDPRPAGGWYLHGWFA